MCVLYNLILKGVASFHESHFMKIYCEALCSITNYYLVESVYVACIFRSSYIKQQETLSDLRARLLFVLLLTAESSKNKLTK